MGGRNPNLPHGTRLYMIWSGMRQRCSNPHTEHYNRYGGRGIKVCPEWEDFSAFEDWAYSHGYREYLSIDRIDNNGPYSPENCRWVTQIEQHQNTSKTVLLTIGGETKSIAAWARESGIDGSTIKRRLQRGKSGQELIAPYRYKPKLHTINGISKTAKDWAAEIGISESSFYDRMKRGWKDKELLKPNRNRFKSHIQRQQAAQSPDATGEGNYTPDTEKATEGHADA